ncbi:error-prone DNA polymerase [Caulobacter mirabilis]|uniref:Error-prone DNA polymerase n=1 Tax=Caulobacter mirabilis TaxID=69666 RepID=A0A2D2AU12_9CAUL|nr:error-prone DNA polymerase [Caulobacter mirabilis]ATQ41463.1 error-prone DNA polymerase [Caulobacter mirabilis]
MTRYVELQATTNYSFLRGASQPGELAATAHALGIEALGITDRNSLAGVVRAWAKAKALGARSLTGCRLDFDDGTPSLLCYPSDREAYARLTKLLTIGQSGAEKGDCILFRQDFLDHSEGQLVLIAPPARLDAAFEEHVVRLRGELGDRVWLAASRGYAAQDAKRLHQLAALSDRTLTPMVATGDVLYHGPERRPLQDVLTCIREGCTIAEAGFRLEANAERHLKSPEEMARLFKAWPGVVERSVEIADRIAFDLGKLKEEYPDEPVPPGKTAIQHLRDLAFAGARSRYPKSRYPDGVPTKVVKNLRMELKLIRKMDYPNYFITVHDIVAEARRMGILCQGRGSAANSSVCYCLGVTAIDPTKHRLLFTRFISENRGEPPDIDVDFEHERREEVMQYVYRRYGRHKAAICATVIHYRPRSAIREVGKVLGLTEDITAALANTVWGSWGGEIAEDHIRQVGLDPKNSEIRRAVAIATELLNFPRHLSQHVGGFVLTKRRLDETVPIGNAAMEDRTFIQWDKDDIDALGLMKVDVLALGMLTALQRGMTMLRQDHGQPIRDLVDIPEEEKGVYDMLSKADSLGVFQVESRAQMSMLPRLRPEKFYDLVIEVAIVRPGPIQGKMVHPYLRRKQGLEDPVYPSPHPDHGPADELEQVLGNTLGVPLFQEQAMSLAIEAAKFTPDEADGLRRAMATFRNLGDPAQYRGRFVGGMVARGYEHEFAERCFKQIEGFGSYGFPESHAASFAKLVYVSAWMKWKWPDVFCAALLNSQPMGFYQPAQLVRDARDHGVEVRAVDLMHSDWDCTLEPAADPAATLKAVRLGFREIKGLKKDEMNRLVAAREAGGQTLLDLARAARLPRRALELLAEADAFRSLGMDRRAALWAVKGEAAEVAADRDTMLDGLPLFEAPAALPQMTLPQHVAEDYRTTGLSLKAHPCEFYRPMLDEMGCVRASDLPKLKSGTRVSLGGLVLIRQRPSTAKGVVFVTLEDETGPANAVVWEDVFKANRRVAMSASFMVVHGRIQRDHDGRKEGEVIHIVVERFTDLTAELGRMREEARPTRPSEEVRTRLVRSRDFH